MNSILIGLGHKARQGKDTAAKTIQDVYGAQYDIRLYSFAKPMKKEVDELDPFALCMRFGIEYDPNPFMGDPLCTTRHGKQPRLLQFWGQHRREQDPFYWVKKVREEIEADHPQFAIITDVRYWNEFHFVKAFGGKTVKVIRQGFTDLTRDHNHISETELDTAKFDYEISVPDGQEHMLKEDAIYVFDHIVSSFTPDTPEADNDVVAAA